MQFGENVRLSREKGDLRLKFYDRMGREISGPEAKTKIAARFRAVGEDLSLLFLTWVGSCPCWAVRKLFYGLAGVKIGPGTKIHMWARFFAPQKITIGQGTIIGDHVFLDGRGDLQIGSQVDIASQVLIYTAEHDVQSEDMRPVEEPVAIEDYAFIGPRAVILPGVKVGLGAVIGAGAVVTKDVPAKTVVGGVPAQKIGVRNIKEFKYRLGRSRLFQ